ALRDAVELRESLYRIFSGLAGGRPPRPDDLATLNARLPRALAYLQVSATRDRFGWAWTGDPVALDRILWPIARAAAVFLTSGTPPRLRPRAPPRGRWVFPDPPGGGPRRWCTMAVCGNRAKVRRHRDRHRG